MLHQCPPVYHFGMSARFEAESDVLLTDPQRVLHLVETSSVMPTTVFLFTLNVPLESLGALSRSGTQDTVG